MSSRRKRTRRQPTGIEQLIELPWQVSAVIGIAAFVFFMLVLPVAAGPVVGSVLSMFGWLALMGFGVTAAVSFLRSRGRSTSFDSSRSAATSESSAPATPALNRLDSEWDKAIPATRMSREGAEAEKPVEWSLSVLRSMEWKRFEYLAAAYYERIGFRTGTDRLGTRRRCRCRAFPWRFGRGRIRRSVQSLERERCAG
jgi:restriction system protein